VIGHVVVASPESRAIPKVIGENQTFVGEEELLRSRGVDLEVLQDATCIQMMSSFIRAHPELWNEDIGV
jgi:creatinine deaminase